MTNKKVLDPHSSPFIPHNSSESAYEPEEIEDEALSYSRPNPSTVIPDHLLQSIQAKPPQKKD